MKKSGFTLAELCVTLAIVGVVAVLAAPSISALMPDSNKTKVVDLYNRIADANAELVNNPDYFLEVDEVGESYTDENSNTVNIGDGIPDCIGLACPSATLSKYNNKPNKYATLLAEKLGGEQENEKITLSKAILGVKSKIDSNYNILYHGIQIRLVGAGDDCLVTRSTGCNKPNIFRIKVENDGSILPADPLLEAYLAHPGELKNRKEYLKEAEKNIDKKYYLEIDF